MPPQITVLYASATGNAEELAAATAARLRTGGWKVVAANLADFPAARLAGEGTVLIIASTWGEGAPPPDAAEFCAELENAAGPQLSRLRYAVLALGSRSYKDFCGCGRRIDEALAGRGATRLRPRVECDTKYKADFQRWLADVEKIIGRPPG